MKRISAERVGCWLFMSLLMVGLLSFGCGADDVKRISKEELKGMFGSPDLRIIDVRLPDQWKTATQKIKGATREESDLVSSWMGKYSKESTLVFYCSWLREATSARMAQEFMKNGYPKAYALKGGWEEWQKAGYPTENK
jgi:rhodanese-related sulfurtransferase